MDLDPGLRRDDRMGGDLAPEPAHPSAALKDGPGGPPLARLLARSLTASAGRADVRHEIDGGEGAGCASSSPVTPAEAGGQVVGLGGAGLDRLGGWIWVPAFAGMTGVGGGLFYTYIMASGRNGTLYAGHTDDLPKRVHHHKEKVGSGFAARYGVDKLVWFESHESRHAAFTRERQIAELLSRLGEARGRTAPRADIRPAP